MKKFKLKNFNQNHKTFPSSDSLQCVKQSKLVHQENLTLLFNAKNQLHQKSCDVLCHKVNTKALIIFAVVCMGILVIYANSEQFFQHRIFSVFPLRRQKAATIHFEDNVQRNVDIHIEKRLDSEPIRSSHYLMNASMQIDVDELYIERFISNYNIFIIYTKEKSNYHLHKQLELLSHSLLKYTDAQLHLHFITDKKSENSILEILNLEVQRFQRTVLYTFYNANECSERIKDIANTLLTYFTASSKSYYSDPLFFLSLGLHRIADIELDQVILLDCDIAFRSDVRLLFHEFNRFLPQQLFGLAPELSTVYRHILYRYRMKYPKTNFGNSYYPIQAKSIGRNIKTGDSLIRNHFRRGYPGLNSGVVLLQLNKLRLSKVYDDCLMQKEVDRLVAKYSFRFHLGDQDFLTLLGYEYPNLIYRLDCIWNRQLCTWWKDHGYSSVFEAYFRCEGQIQIYHGNCKTRIPE